MYKITRCHDKQSSGTGPAVTVARLIRLDPDDEIKKNKAGRRSAILHKQKGEEQPVHESQDEFSRVESAHAALRVRGREEAG